MHFPGPTVALVRQDGSGVPMRTLLETLAARVRARREARGWSRTMLARRSGLSLRYLARVETGDGNLSILRLEALARALDTTPDLLLRADLDPSRLVALVGLRGAGKSTVGRLLARRLDREFIEVDDRITEACGLPLDQLFELHGESYYRRLEQESLRRIVAAERPAVLAVGGGVVHEPTTWALLREQTTVVWLRARAEDHWSRVVAQGDRRPMADNPAAMDELRTLLRARQGLYAQAHWTADTSEATPEIVADAIRHRLDGMR